jgi:toxin ParE1/3/4
MTGFVLTNRAEADLKSIGIYTQNKWGVRQRNRYLTALDKSFHALAADHLNGRDCGEIRTGYRKYQVGKHIVFFREIDENLIEVVRILHERMDIEARLSEN